jgi:uncharacterized protein YqfA (UPF0365 family)
MEFLTVVFAGIIIFVVLVLFWLLPIPLWLSAKFANVNVSLLQLVFMRFRRVPPGTIVNAMVTSHKAGLPIERDMLEAHYLAGGNVERVIRALISADKPTSVSILKPLRL